MTSLGTRLTLVISSTLIALMLAAGFWLDRQLTATIYEEELSQTQVHANTMLASLQTLMLNGQGTLAREWLDRMNDTPGLFDIDVLRRDGSEAFTDLSTLQQVNDFLGMDRFRRDPVTPGRLESKYAGEFERALQGRTASVLDEKAGTLTVFVPIDTGKECLACHGYEQSPLRGVFKLQHSTEQAETRIRDMRRSLWAISGFLTIVLGAAMWFAIRLSVLRPVATLRAAIARVGLGERGVKLPVTREDELGDVAVQFNRMLDKLAESEAQIRAVMDNVLDGIVAMDEQGIIEAANPAAGRLFGYSMEELIGKNVSVLMPEPLGSLHDGYLQHYLQSGHADVVGVTRELSGRRKGGTVFPLELSLSEMWTGDRRRLVGIMRDITERKEQTALLEYQALHDALTNLPNRSLLYDRLNQAILGAERQRKPLALLLIDLDQFKEINDTLGHHIGDQLLQQVAERIYASVRESDTVARLGGDEFAILLPTADVEHARQIARKINSGMERPFAFDGQTLHVGASIGIAMYPEHGKDQAMLMKRADVAMYSAKRSRSGHAVYDVSDDPHSLRYLALQNDLRSAIDAGQLVVHYQPKIRLDTGRVFAAEALVRWNHPEHGLMDPDEFIPLAEHSGLIRPLTLWVIKAALRECADCLKQGIDLEVAVNLSARNLQDHEFPDQLARIFEERAVPCANLRLEITETDLMENPVRAEKILARISGMGVRLSIDDFGTGYSSLGYLKRLPVDELKIDKSFVIDLVRDGNDAAIVRSTIDLAHNFGLQVVAEGVENEETYNALVALECDAVQGFFISPPLPLPEFKRWLVESDRGLPAVAQAELIV